MAEGKASSRARKSVGEQTPRQVFDGKTYACQSCKNGHRVKTCNHGRTKPIAPTNQPGRPSSGSKRKCTCSKNCGCAGSCKCDKNCLCTQKMYLIALVEKPDATGEIKRTASPQPPVWKNEQGQAETLRSVWADASGQLLSDAEAERRQREKEQREQGKAACCSSEAKREASPHPTTGCRHRDKIMDKSTPPDPSIGSTTAPVKTAQCTCGQACQCTLCPEHPNNAATRQYNAQQLNHMMGLGYLPAPSTMTGQAFTPQTPQGSCMGGQQSFYLSRTPNFEPMFPSGAQGDYYIMSYPVNARLQPQQDLDQFDSQALQMPVNMLPADDALDELMTADFDFGMEADPASWEPRFGDASVNSISGPSFAALSAPKYEMADLPPTMFHNQQSMPNQPAFNAQNVIPSNISASASTYQMPPIPASESSPMPSAYAALSQPMITSCCGSRGVSASRSASAMTGSGEVDMSAFDSGDLAFFDQTLPAMPASPKHSPMTQQAVFGAR